MTDLLLVKHATASPTTCLMCGTAKGPFIDTRRSFPGYGHAFICVGDDYISGCVVQMGRIAGMEDNQESRLKDANLTLLRERVQKLEETCNQLLEQVGHLTGSLREELLNLITVPEPAVIDVPAKSAPSKPKSAPSGAVPIIGA